MGYGKNPSIRGAVRSNQALKKYLRVVTDDLDGADKVSSDNTPLPTEPADGSDNTSDANDGTQTDNITELEKRLPDGVRRCSVSVANAGRLDLENARFFIDKERSYSAEVRFEKKGSNPVTVVIVACLTIVTALLAIKVLPDLLRMLDNFIGMVKGR